MQDKNIFDIGRRDLLTKVVPVCAASCLGASKLFAGTSGIKEVLSEQDN